MAVYSTLPRGHTFVCDHAGCTRSFAAPTDDLESAEGDAFSHGWEFRGMRHYCDRHAPPRGGGLAAATRGEIAETIEYLDQAVARVKATLARLSRS